MQWVQVGPGKHRSAQLQGGLWAERSFRREGKGQDEEGVRGWVWAHPKLNGRLGLSGRDWAHSRTVSPHGAVGLLWHLLEETLTNAPGQVCPVPKAQALLMLCLGWPFLGAG